MDQQKNRSIDETLSPSAEQRISGVCARFQGAWKSGAVPAIDEYLAEAGESDRAPLLRRLLLIELKYRSGTGETMSRERYQKLFPDHVELIDSVFSSAQVTPSLAETVDPSPADTGSGTVRDVAGSPVAEGKRFGRFQLIEALGRGGFGAVHLAYDPQLDREVALKFPRAGTLVDERDVQRFMREARAAAQLRHPNLVPVYEAGEIDGTCYIASAYVPGKTLRDTIKDQGQFSHRDAATLVAKLAEALHFAHQKGIVHRDMKPENVMIDEAGEPHIMDFGLARRDEGEELLTQEGSQMGTPAYMSPEQVKGESHTADARTDLWSLGVILYELLTGQRPFEVRSAESLAKIVRDEPQPPRKLDRSIPKDLETICLKCLNKQPDARYESCEAVHDELLRWLHNEPIEARPISRIERTWRWCRRKPALTGFTASVAVLIVIIAVIAFQILLRPRPAITDTWAQDGTAPAVVGMIQNPRSFHAQDYSLWVGVEGKEFINLESSGRDTVNVHSNTGKTTVTLSEKTLDALAVPLRDPKTKLVFQLRDNRGQPLPGETVVASFNRPGPPLFDRPFAQPNKNEPVLTGSIDKPFRYHERQYQIWIETAEGENPVHLTDPSREDDRVQVETRDGSVRIALSDETLDHLDVVPGGQMPVAVVLKDSEGEKALSKSTVRDFTRPEPRVRGEPDLIGLEPPGGEVVEAESNELWQDFRAVRDRGKHDNVLQMTDRVIQWLEANQAPQEHIDVVTEFRNILADKPDHVDFLHYDTDEVGPYIWDVNFSYKGGEAERASPKVLVAPNMHTNFLSFAQQAAKGGLPDTGQSMFISLTVEPLVSVAWRYRIAMEDREDVFEDLQTLEDLENGYLDLNEDKGYRKSGKPFPHFDMREMDANKRRQFLAENRDKIQRTAARSYARRYREMRKGLDFLHWAVRNGLYSEEKASEYIDGATKALTRRLHTEWYFHHKYILPLQQLKYPTGEEGFRALFLAYVNRHGMRAASKGKSDFGEFGDPYHTTDLEDLIYGLTTIWIYASYLAVDQGPLNRNEMEQIIEFGRPDAGKNLNWYRQFREWVRANPDLDDDVKSVFAAERKR